MLRAEEIHIWLPKQFDGLLSYFGKCNTVCPQKLWCKTCALKQRHKKALAPSDQKDRWESKSLQSNARVQKNAVKEILIILSMDNPLTVKSIKQRSEIHIHTNHPMHEKIQEQIRGVWVSESQLLKNKLLEQSLTSISRNPGTHKRSTGTLCVVDKFVWIECVHLKCKKSMHKV